MKDSLRERYDIDLAELLREAKIKEVKVNVPVSVFKQEMSPAESLCKYLKENRGLRLSEIARVLSRDQRTIWINYNNSLKKKREMIEIKEEREEIIPIQVFSDRRFSILESLIYYLREKGLKNREVARTLNKDPRNVWSLYSRAVKKMRNR